MSQPHRHVLRSILQRLRTNVDLVGGDSSASTRQYLLAKSKGATTEQHHKLAETYAKLLEDLKERKRLLDIDTGADMKLTPRELSRRAAARAGLQLPDLDPELEKDR